MSIRDLALSLGFPVFPVLGKLPHPCLREGFKGRKEGWEWGEGWPDDATGIGYVPADLGWCVIDVDLGHDPADIAELPATRRHRSPSGAYHLIYKTPEVFTNARLAPHIDIRSGNGYAIWPGSTGYSLAAGIPVAPLPEETAAKLRAKRDRVRAEYTGGNDSPDNVRRAALWLKRQAKDIDGFTIAVNLIGSLNLTMEAADRIWSDWQSSLEWQWPDEERELRLNNAARYSNNEGEYALPDDLAKKHGWVRAEPPFSNIAEDWMTRDIKPILPLIGPISTTSRIFMAAETGLGKTHFAMAVGAALAAGTDLLHWKVPEAKRVLYIDGEMPLTLIKDRVTEAVRRAGPGKGRWVIISKTDFPDVAALNLIDGEGSQPGWEWVIALVDAYNPNLVIFDNIQSLLVGDLNKPEGFAPMLEGIRNLTMRGIAQIWVHHANATPKKSDGSYGHATLYGDKTRTWQMDTVIMLDRIEDTKAVRFAMRFAKHRELHPGRNGSAYQEGQWALNRDWEFKSDDEIERETAAAAPDTGEQYISGTEFAKRLGVSKQAVEKGKRWQEFRLSGTPLYDWERYRLTLT